MFCRCCLVLTAGLMLQAETPLRELAYARPVMFPNEIVPLYDKGFLLYPLRPNRLEILRPGGQPASSIDVSCPGSGTCSITSLAVNSSGSIAVGLGYLTAGGRTGAIRVIDTGGRELHFIGTSDYLPSTVCFDADDNLWSVGREAEPTGFERADYSLVRKFSRDGKELGRYLPKLLWPAKKAQPSRIGGGYWHLRAASDRLGIAIHENHADNPAEWVEWDLAGNLLTRTMIKTDYSGGRAFTSNGRFYGRFRVPDSKRLELRVLDKKTGTWTTVADNLPDTPEFERAFLLGADGNDLVYSLDFRLVLVRPAN